MYFYAVILQKKRLCCVFAMATLPQEGFGYFEEICKKYAKGKLKDQRAMAKDLKAIPTFKPAYTKCLLNLDVSDRVELLKKVNNSNL